VYENSIKVWSRENLLVMNYVNNYSPNTYFDTVVSRIGKDALKSSAKMPQIVGIGVSYGYKDRLTTAFDFSWQNWKQFKMSNLKDTLNNNIVAALGVQYVPNPTSSKYYNKINFRLGTRISSGYMKIYNKPISEFAISAGLGFPIRTFNFRSSANITFEYSKFGTLKNNLILQNYFKLSFNFILQERWYQRRKID
jgi:long-subunit fatty acid transport protein